MELENNNKFIDIFSSLLFNSKNRSEFLVIFLSSVLDDLSLKTKLIESFELIKINLISIWCRLLVSELDSETKDYLSTRIFVLLKETNQVNLTENHQDSSSIFSNFTKDLLANFLNCDFGKRSALLSEAHNYFNDMVLTSEQIVKKEHSDLSQLKACYEFISILFANCSQLLYVRFKPDCLLPRITDSIITPSTIHSSNILQKHFPLVCFCF